MEGSSSCQFDIENGKETPYIPLLTSGTGELNKVSTLSPDCCIYKVPRRLRCVNEEAYTPQVVSLGPLHHGEKGLIAMEEHKKRYLQDFLDRTEVSLEDYIKKIKVQEAKVRNYYAEPIGFRCDNEFAEIILVDAAFILELLLKNRFKKLVDENDRIFNKPWMIHCLVPDMLLLENQLPFSILEELFYPETIRTKIDHSTKFSLIDLSLKFFEDTMEFKGEKGNLKSCSNPKVEHFVDFIRKLHLPKETSKTQERAKTLTTPSITELHEAGVKFKKGSGNNLFDIRFTNGILEIPKIQIDDHTELILRNMLAFEQCHCMEYYICDYVSILDDFVNTKKDVELLAEKGIVENFIGEHNKVSTLINNLCNGVSWSSENHYYASLSKELNEYCKKPCHKWVANLRHKYFHTPWATISVIAAVLLLILTIIQTVCSLISVIS